MSDTGSRGRNNSQTVDTIGFYKCMCKICVKEFSLCNLKLFNQLHYPFIMCRMQENTNASGFYNIGSNLI